MSTSFLKVFDNTTAPPAPKRRRLGETILETALNAALVGTAVGLAALRLYVSHSCAVRCALAQHSFYTDGGIVERMLKIRLQSLRRTTLPLLLMSHGRLTHKPQRCVTKQNLAAVKM